MSAWLKEKMTMNLEWQKIVLDREGQTEWGFTSKRIEWVGWVYHNSIYVEI